LRSAQASFRNDWFVGIAPNTAGPRQGDGSGKQTSRADTASTTVGGKQPFPWAVL